MASRNEYVEQAVTAAINRIDDFIGGATLQLPRQPYREARDDLLSRQSASVRTCMLFLMFYRLFDASWDLQTVPIGSRGKYGDKRLSEELSRRHLTLHENIVAWGENIGSKSGVRQFKFTDDPRFKPFLDTIASADVSEQRRIADYFAERFAASRRVLPALPAVDDHLLTFARARVLFTELLDLPSEGHIPQFLVTALLSEFRKPLGITVTTHHPHAADRYDNTAGDIEEHREGRLIRAYEVTMRDDWQNRLSGFKQKMDQFGLNKYIIIAANINTTSEWAEPAKMALALNSIGRDIAVLDIRDVLNFLAADLTASELRDAINHAFALLTEPRLSGNLRFIEAFRRAVGDWLDEA